MVDESVADFVIQNFTKIAMVSVSVEAIDLSDIAPKEEKIKEVRTTVASLRLDAVASSGFSVSRTKIGKRQLNAGLLQVNWQPAKGASQEVKEGDVISMRGRGRMKVEAITGTSRKGRIGVYLKRFMQAIENRLDHQADFFTYSKDNHGIHNISIYNRRYNPIRRRRRGGRATNTALY